ncbi:LacI family DNA-binding transcriptional regulator [Vagococcus fluvialis]|uniref:LacI family DNA-binding transcriptional regulator n=1 Tax=Vagococcus fluvialis TaxID=2738 RepID=UPI00288D2C21|nr:LacI family DNA-binding transcriptional regulator [Vagococcus fluvialis]MDT2780389.1 LacI family DNA-binding transcriptional regulator [Vagococcus fluvialis]
MGKLTIREIADLAGVSTTTVSHILNDKGQRFSEETRNRVLKVIEENRYTPNYFASNIIKK